MSNYFFKYHQTGLSCSFDIYKLVQVMYLTALLLSPTFSFSPLFCVKSSCCVARHDLVFLIITAYKSGFSKLKAFWCELEQVCDDRSTCCSSRFPLLWHINLLNSIYYRLTLLLLEYFLKLTFSHLGKSSPFAHTQKLLIFLRLKSQIFSSLLVLWSVTLLVIYKLLLLTFS